MENIDIDETRLKAVNILETIATMLNDEGIFDCTPKDDTKWYRFEDAVYYILKGR